MYKTAVCSLVGGGITHQNSSPKKNSAQLTDSEYA